MGLEIAKTGQVNVDRTNIDRDFILDIRLGNSTYDELINYLDSKRKKWKMRWQNLLYQKILMLNL